MSEDVNRKLYYAAGDAIDTLVLVSQLIEQGAEVDWKGDEYGQTALHRAASGGQPRVVSRLLDSGWSLESRAGVGYTPLRLAARNGHLETAKCLLLRGANIDTQTDGKWTPLHEASIEGHNDMV